MKLNRRRFLLGLSSAALLEQLPIFTRIAQAASGTDYKALVCVFLFGGNDGNNTIIPMDSAGFAAYAKARGDYTQNSTDLGFPQSSLTALMPASPIAGLPLSGLSNSSQSFALHPDLSPLTSLWNNGQLAALFNTGTLIGPVTKAQYTGKSQPLPENLFSHADQQNQWQTAYSQGPDASGWGGRIADALASSNAGASIPTVISTAGSTLFTSGKTSAPLTIPSSGTFGLNNFGGSYASSVSSAYASLLSADQQDQLVNAGEKISSAGLTASKALNPIITATASTDSLFSGQTSGISQQLLRVAKIIGNQSQFGVSRQIFFVSLGGFDTHTNQIATQSNLFKQLAPALKSFNDAMAQLGTSSQVTTFTLSDFARTLQPASGGGSDHAWGNHHFIMGGAVKGQSYYGTFPNLALGGPDDVTTQGRWLPSTSVDQYGATLASWFGVPAAQMAAVFPNLANYGSSTNLGFMKTS